MLLLSSKVGARWNCWSKRIDSREEAVLARPWCLLQAASGHSWKLISILSYLREAPRCIHVKSEQKNLLCTGFIFLQQTASFLTTWLWFPTNLSWLINLPPAFNYLSIMSKCKVIVLGKIFQSLRLATFNYLLKEKINLRKNKVEKLHVTLKLTPIEIACRK